MIRKEVERIMGLVFTPEELKVITTAVKVSKSKLYHKKSETKEDLKNCYNKYYVWQDQSRKNAKLYSILMDMAKNYKGKLIKLWDKILETRKLECPKDIDEELFLSFSKGNTFIVYNDKYWVDKIQGNTVTFKREDE